jgi:hypothetical protein
MWFIGQKLTMYWGIDTGISYSEDQNVTTNNTVHTAAVCKITNNGVPY